MSRHDPWVAQKLEIEIEIEPTMAPEALCMIDIFERIRERRARVGIVGMGYVGLPLAMRFAKVGFPVLGIECDAARVAKLNARVSYLEQFSSEELRESFGPALERSQRESASDLPATGFFATTDAALARQCDALIICVPTPLDAHREPDLSYVIATTEQLLPHLRPGQIVSLESTTYPGTTEEELRPRIEAAGLTIGEDIFLVYSPEREDPGNAKYHTGNIPKVCGGSTSRCLEVGVALYEAAIERVVPVTSTRAAELTKLLENIHRAVNIGLVNEMKKVADAMGIDIYEVIDAAATKPFGFTPYYPGPGLGGHCIPIDPFYLTWKAREYGLTTKFIELAGEVNSDMPSYVVAKVAFALNSRSKSINGARILVLGAAYKKNVDDLRESPSLVIMRKLAELGASITYSDPHLPKLTHAFSSHGSHSDSAATHAASESAWLSRICQDSISLSPGVLSSLDCVIVATDHDKFDYDQILEHAPLIVDTRGKYRKRNSKVFPA
jgi:UDP-N-acetyl-D-glucosamine dehydrogenase